MTKEQIELLQEHANKFHGQLEVWTNRAPDSDIVEIRIVGTNGDDSREYFLLSLPMKYSL